MAAAALFKRRVTVLLHERRYIPLTHGRRSFPRPMKRKHLSSWLLMLAGTVTAAVSLAAASADPYAGIRKTLKEHYPEVEIVDIKPSPLNGLYEIYTGDAIVYANDSGSYLIAGPLVETRTRANLTAESLDMRNAIDFSTLPIEKAIKTVKGNGSRKMAVFADPDCPYCKKLEHELVSVDNVTVYTFLYPLEELHPDAKARAHAIWCSADRSEAWNSWIVNAKDPSPAPASCKQDVLEENRALGVKLRVNSTPTIIFANGRRTSGVVPAADIERRLDAKNTTKQTPRS
jgi:thiol:disulfide interchange protein DsbC